MRMILLLSLLAVACSGPSGFSADSLDTAVDSAAESSGDSFLGPDVQTVDTVDVTEDIVLDVQAQDISTDIPPDTCVNSCCPTSQTDYCNGLDDDCDGRIDEDPTPCEITAYPEGTPCRSGTLRCVNGQPGTCSGPSPAAEICDGVDNDCNTLTDDNPAIPLCGHGLCSASGSCSSGQITCVPRDDLAIPEVCGNSIDDDCDNMVDEQPCTP